MGTLSVNKLAGLSLIFGPLIAFVFFLIEPGGLLVERVKLSDAGGSIAAAANNTFLANLTNMMIILGLAILIYGLYVLQSRVGASGNGKALTQMGFLLLLFGVIGWTFSSATSFILADAQGPEEIRALVPVYYVGSSMLYAGGLFIGLGSVLFSLGLSTRADFNPVICLVGGLVFLVILACFVVGIFLSENIDTIFTVARIFYVGWVLWLIYLGFGLLNKPDPLASD